MTRKKNSKLTRRRLLQGAGVAAAATAMPHVWIPREVKATSAFDGQWRVAVR